MTDKKWTIIAKQYSVATGYMELVIPTERILEYHFTNEVGQTFKISTLDKGKIKISVDANLIIHPRSSNSIVLEAQGHRLDLTD